MHSTGANVNRRRAEIISGTLRVLNGCISQQQAAMRTAMAARRVVLGASSSGSRSKPWGVGNEWESCGLGAQETRLRLLTLQGQWLEAEEHLLSERGAVNNAGGIDSSGSSTRALTRLEEAVELGERMISLPAVRSTETEDATSTPITSASRTLHGGYSQEERTGATSVLRAASEAMLRLAKLCDGLVTDPKMMTNQERMAGRGREQLAALAVKQYLRAMSAG